MRPRFLPILTACVLTLLVAGPAHAQDAEARFALEVPGGAETLDRLGIRPEERGVALVLLARGLHGVVGSGAGGSLAMTVTEVVGPPPLAGTGPGRRRPAAAASAKPAVILAPLSERAWQRALGLGGDDDLFRALLHHRGALLVAAGALQAGPGVRPWLDGRTGLLQQIMRQWPGAFAVAAQGLALDDGGWRVPGGDALAQAWAALVGAHPSRTEDFLRRLLARDGGRLARFYATLGRLDQDWLAALTLPLPGEDATRALSSLYTLARDAEAPADPNTHPYQLGYADLASLLLALDDLPLSSLPASAGRWAALLDTRVDSRIDAGTVVTGPASPTPLAAVLRAQLRGAPRARRDRVAMVALARQVWDGEAPAAVQADAVYALAHFPRFRGLLLMLDRIGLRDPALWARAIDAARQVEAGGTRDRDWRLGLYQGALALVERATLVGSLPAVAAGRALGALADAVATRPALDTAVHEWLLEHFIPALPPLIRPDRFSGPTAYESRVLQALAGPPTEAPRPLAWEGLPYEVDVTAAEHARILAIRSQIPSPGLDAALDRRDGRALAAALRALAYAPALGDPEGAITLSPDVVERHDFGGTRTTPGRDVAWLPAQERTGTGAPWHATGSLLGLDLAFAGLALRRLSFDDMPPVPTVNLNDQFTLTRTVLAVQSRHLGDDTRDEVAAALERGRSRIEAAAGDAAAVAALGRAVGWTKAEVQAWADGRANAGSVAARFSLRQILALGAPSLPPATLARWGVLGEAVDGRLVTRLDAPRRWDDLAGRPETGILATQVPDLTLRLVEITAALRLPAALIPALLAYATQDYWHDVEARFADDWPAMVRGARLLSTARVEDYVSALASGGPLRPRRDGRRGARASRVQRAPGGAVVTPRE